MNEQKNVWKIPKHETTDLYVGEGYPCAGQVSANAAKDFDSNPLVTWFDENLGIEEPIGSYKSIAINLEEYIEDGTTEPWAVPWAMKFLQFIIHCINN